MSIKKFIIGIILILSLTIFIDQLTKYIAFIVLFKDQQVLIINHYLNFRPVWNFNRVLLDKQGMFVASFGSFTNPNSRKIKSKIINLLKN